MMFLAGFLLATLLAVGFGVGLWYYIDSTVSDVLSLTAETGTEAETMIHVDEQGRVFEVAEDGSRVALATEVVVVESDPEERTLDVPGLEGVMDRDLLSRKVRGPLKLQTGPQPGYLARRQLGTAAVGGDIPFVLIPIPGGFRSYYGMPPDGEAIYYAGQSLTKEGGETQAKLAALRALGRAQSNGAVAR